MVRVSLGLAATLLTSIMAQAPVSAAPPGGTPFVRASSSQLQFADWNVRHHRWVYNPRIHGHRFAYRNGTHRYFYGGWWYAQPWWGSAPAVVIEPGYTVVEPGYTVVEPDPGYEVVEPDQGYEPPGYDED